MFGSSLSSRCSPGKPRRVDAIIAGAIAVVSRSRYAPRPFVLGVRKLPWRVAIVGAAEIARSIKRKLELCPDLDVTIVEACDARGLRERGGRMARWRRSSDRSSSALDDSMPRDRRQRPRTRYSSASFRLDHVDAAVRLGHLASSPYRYTTVTFSRSTLLLKRALDVVCSGIALVLLSPVFSSSRWRSRRRIGDDRLLTAARGRDDTFTMTSSKRSSENADIAPQFVLFDDLAEPVFNWKTILGRPASDDGCDGGPRQLPRSSTCCGAG